MLTAAMPRLAPARRTWVALQRGPIVYCLEGVDNDGQVRNLALPRDAKLSASFEKDLLRGVEVVRGAPKKPARCRKAAGPAPARTPTEILVTNSSPPSHYQNKAPGPC